MAQAGQKPGIFYGWWIVAASTIGAAMCQSPVIFLTLGVFMIPLHDAFGWDRSTVSLALSVGALTLAFAVPAMGNLLDKLGPRKVLLPSMVMFALGTMSLYFLTDSLWHFLGTYALIGIIGAGANTVSYARVLTAWFDKHRGLALGIAMAGIGLGGGLSPLVAQSLMDAYDWRAAYLGLGVMVLVIGFPVVYFLLRETPQEMGLNPDGASDAEVSAAQAKLSTKDAPGMTRGEALRSREFWMLWTIVFFIAIALHGFQIHLVPLLRDNGLTPQTAALAASLMGVATVVARVCVGYLFDKFFAPYVGVAVFLFPCAAMAMLGYTDTVWMGILCAVFIGIGGGAESDLIAYLIGRYFGLKAFGELYGYVFGALMLGTAIGPYAIGLAHDMTGSYQEALWICVAVTAGICFMLTRFGPFPKWGTATH